MEADSEDSAWIGIHRLEPPARLVKHGLALGGDVSGQKEDKAAQRIDFIVFGGQPPIDGAG